MATKKKKPKIIGEHGNIEVSKSPITKYEPYKTLKAAFKDLIKMFEMPVLQKVIQSKDETLESAKEMVEILTNLSHLN